MKVVITGAYGMLGKDVLGELSSDDTFTVFPVELRKNDLLQHKNQVITDITDIEALNKVLDSIKPDAIIHCAANTNLENCEVNREFTYKLHVLSTKALASYKPEKTRMIYISTDSVFDGGKGNYSETDAPHPLNYYAQTKLEGEKSAQESNQNSLILRTNIYGFHVPKGRSFFVEGALELLSKGEKIKGFDNIFFNPVYTKQLARIIKRALLNGPKSGIFHIGSKNGISKYDFLAKTAEVFGFPAGLVEKVQADFSVPRPKDTTMNISRAIKAFNETPEIAEGLKELKNDYSSYGSLL